jgi:hypothetical protein
MQRSARRHDIVDEQHSFAVHHTRVRDVLRPDTSLYFGVTSLRTRADATQCPSARDAHRARDTTGDNSRLVVTAHSHSSSGRRHPRDDIGTPLAMHLATTSGKQHTEACGDPTVIAKLHRVNRTTQLAAIHPE